MSVTTERLKQPTVGATVQPVYIGGTATDGSDAPIQISTGKVVNLNAGTTVGGVLVASQSYANSLLAEYTVTGSAVTSIDFSGLDINTHKSYRIEIDMLNVTASNGNLYMFINNDTVIGNYYFQHVGGSGTTAYASRGNFPTVTWMDASSKSKSVISLTLNFGYPITSQYDCDNIGSSIRSFVHAMCKATTVTNITQLTFTASVANSIGVGSTIRIYRGNV